ncbi:hypothetical protein [Shewanella phage SFCi1]|nr:hypothetical protein [Shewanella phage SFCi1]
MFKVFQHLLPNARAWRLTTNKLLRQFFEGLGAASQNVRDYFDLVLDDLYPQTTRALDEWEAQFGLPSTGLTEQQRRDRLAATWKALGGQDPSYIQQTLRDNGFDVYVHEWWETGTEPPVGFKACVTPRNPLLYIRRSTAPRVQLSACGYATTTCGNLPAICGNGVEPAGYPLVNKIETSRKTYTASCGNLSTTCGNAQAACGEFNGCQLDMLDYIVPLDPSKWPYLLYIGGEVFPDLAQVPVDRKNEFEALCLKICPTQNWIGVLVQYT